MSSEAPDSGREMNVARTEIAQMYRDIRARLSGAERDLLELQEVCSHPALKKTHRANTGNYDPSADFYWTKFDCPDCGKSWMGEGSV
jgi:hypothetical protein